MNDFSAKQNDVTIKYRLAENEGHPVKLGDGSFGVVLKAFDARDEPAAVKLYYVNPDLGVTQRNDEEMRLRHEIAAIERKTGRSFEKSGLVLPEATVDSFLSSNAYKKHEEFFVSSGLQLTGKGIVMEYFDCTLKDLLERGAPAGRYSAGRPTEKSGNPAYAILRATAPEEREKYVLPILKQLALALQALHGYGFHHHDLKPANILLKSQGGTIRAALGDFGFADPNSEVNTRVIKVKDEAMAEGTRHYRSVEQKDNVDVCEVDVEVIENADDTVALVLVTRDAKFFDSIIEKDDICVFRKDSGRRPWFVEKIERKANDVQLLTTITLRAERARDKSGNKIAVAADKRTQVAFLKQQTHRTDLFGFGAVAFDLITAGCSPERFYDLLRSLDKLQEDGDPSQVSTIRAAYAAFAAAPSAEPTHRALFNELKAGTAFPSPAFVGIILKCMLSKPLDSYFGGDGKVKCANDCFRELCYDVSALTELTATKYSADNFNPLWLEGGQYTAPPVMLVPEFGVVLRTHRKSLLKDSTGVAIVRAYKLLKQIMDTVEEALLQHEETSERSKVFLSLLGPDHLEADGRLDPQSAAYPTEQAYYDALQSGEVVSFGSSLDASSFLPPRMRYRMRQVTLVPLGVSEGNGGDAMQFRYAYRDSSPCWPGVQSGDIARLWNTQRVVTLFRIERISDEVIALTNIESVDKRPSRPTATETLSSPIERAEFVKQICASDYYLGVLAIYLHQLFFPEGGESFASLSSKMWWLEEADCLGFLDREKMRGACFPKRQSVEGTTHGVQSRAAALYVWLLLRGYAGEDNGGILQGPELRGLIRSKVNNLGETIARALGKNVEWLDALVKGTTEMLEANGDIKHMQLDKLSPRLEGFIDRLKFGDWIDAKQAKSWWKG